MLPAPIRSAFLCLVLGTLLAVAPNAGAAPPGPLSTIGAEGTGDGQFDLPFGVAVGPAGDIYVTDQTNSRVEKFTVNGAFQRKWGEFGPVLGQFSSPAGIAVAPDGGIWVADSNNNHLDHFGPDGEPEGGIELSGDPDHSVSHPIGLAIGRSGNLYVSSPEINHVDVFAPDGTFVTGWGEFGAGPRQFFSPQGIAIDNDFVYVADLLNKRVEKFTLEGSFVAQWPVFNPDDGTPNGPTGIAVDPSATDTQGRVLVVDQDAGVVLRYTGSGDLVEAFGQGMLNRPWGIGVDCRGTVTVADSFDKRLVRFGDPAAQPPPCPAPPSPPPPGAPGPSQGLTAAFSISPNPAIRGLPVTFDASQSTAAPGDRIVRYQWDLDGNGSLETDTAGSPTATGTYLARSTTITLQVTDDPGRTATAQRLLVPQRFDVAVAVNRGRPLSVRALRRGLRLKVSALPVTRRLDVAVYRARASGRKLGRRIARTSLAVRPNARGTITARWPLGAAARRRLRPGRYAVVVHAYPRAAFRPATGQFTVARRPRG